MATKLKTESTAKPTKKCCGGNCGKTTKKVSSSASRKVESGTEMCSSSRATRTRSNATKSTKTVSKARKTR